ncbi:MAG: tetraacyldisaccharide 4'-kinase [Gammaproteobacteria bacterium]|nr:tetraacyldisaccharide 4'-kinase [Gammaproteobacteria bacterium]|tara:strand:+ start:1010 stop:1189 length:180 start_codon:yes stop_codon:yes gene_type:complete
MALDKTLLDILVCPICKGNLTYQQDSQELICFVDKLAFRIEDDIPIMVPDEARKLEIEK